MSLPSIRSLYILLCFLLAALYFTPFKFLSLVYGSQVLFAMGYIYLIRMKLADTILLPSLKTMFLTFGICFLSFLMLYLFQIRIPIRANSWIIFINFLILSPFAEELFFRQAILGSMLKFGIPKTYSIVTSSFLFGAYHLIGIHYLSSFKTFIILQAIYGFFVGLFLATTWIKSKSLIKVIILHILINLSFLIFIKIYY